MTRDRIGTLVSVGDEPDEPRYFELIDTGGIGMVDRDDLTSHVEQQIETAMTEADLILFVVDCREGLMPLDEEVASRLRYVDKPVILVINKADEAHLEATAAEFHRLGRGTPVYVSVLQNRNRSELLDTIAGRLPDGEDRAPADAVMKVAVVGRPNTGKSTFINTLAHAERMIVSEVPGTTRDSVDVRFELDGLPFIAIDTAGVRRKAKIRDDLDFYSLHRGERSIRRADVVFLFIDPSQGVTRLDKQLADYIAKQYKPCVFVVNKWDIMMEQSGGSMEDDEQVFVWGPARIPHDGLRPDRVHHGQDGQEREGALESRPGDVQAGRQASRHLDAQPGPPSRRSRPIRRRQPRIARRRFITPPRSAPPRRRSSCSSTPPRFSTPPISATS